MDKNIIGILFIFVGVLYGSLAIDSFYEHTLGWLVKHDFIQPPKVFQNRNSQNSLGRKATILMYSIIMIAVGIFILIKK
ncbi:MAG: hypothetical protein JNN11_03555 [Candidatus Doudnabacteria bacterium]|nr:hypothetical protein [Candidatus Doudnabacteria bacterium]